MTTTRQRRNVRRSVVAAFLGAVVIALVATTGGVTRPEPKKPGGGESGAVGGPGSSVTISGDAAGSISPGSLAPINLALDNTNDFDMAIDQITVTIQAVVAPSADADRPCTAADFEVRRPFGGGVLTLEAHQVDNLSGMGLAREQWPAIAMLNRPVNQDGCKGASLTLEYQASGVEVK